MGPTEPTSKAWASEHWLAMAGVEHDRDVLDTRIAFAFFAQEVVADAGYFPIEIDEIGLGADCKLAPPACWLP